MCDPQLQGRLPAQAAVPCRNAAFQNQADRGSKDRSQDVAGRPELGSQLTTIAGESLDCEPDTLRSHRCACRPYRNDIDEARRWGLDLVSNVSLGW